MLFLFSTGARNKCNTFKNFITPPPLSLLPLARLSYLSHIFCFFFFFFFISFVSPERQTGISRTLVLAPTMSQRLESLETEFSSSLDLRGDLNSLYDTLRLQFFSLNYDLLLEIRMVPYQLFGTLCVQLAIGLFRNCLCQRRIGNFHVSIFFPLFCVQ